jgi:membrane-associated phospholipid phosphatase
VRQTDPLTRRHPAVLLAPAVGLAAIYVHTAHEVAENEWSTFDRWLLLAMHDIASPVAGVVMEAFTFLGSGIGLTAVALLVGIWCVRRGQRRLALTLWGVGLAAELCNLLLKLAYVRVRPALWEDVRLLTTFSFPSGHAMNAAATLGMCAYVIARVEPRWRTAAWCITPVLVAGVGLSRLYLGVHWPSDVLGGWAAGGLVLLAGVALASRVRHARPREVVADRA